MLQYHDPMSFSETIFLFFLALIIFGPKKLPEIARQVGKWMNEFRRASNEFKSQIEQEIAHLDVENRQTILPPSPAVDGTASRTLDAAQSQSDTGAEPPATLAGSNEESKSAEKGNGSELSATEAVPHSELVPSSEAVPAAEPVTSSPSQETHA